MTFAHEDVRNATPQDEENGVEAIDYCGRRIVCPVAAHPDVAQIKVALVGGESHEWIADQYGIPSGYDPERENVGTPNRGAFVRRFKMRHPEIFAGSRPAA
ncbi:MAG: hypothetical protein KGL39_41290 [Patescibacteria group bacterium]|nr:hypothetical protein [Patescibacteria group bacterium]